MQIDNADTNNDVVFALDETELKVNIRVVAEDLATTDIFEITVTRAAAQEENSE